ncbi:MAG: cytochrome c [Candidatus Tectomicrobia bacterium]|uniref:Cytochrome c n=1 Tax=Tectimicrobiota bacterium TaxID=2528274 RepID=A0A932GMZ0_UNCTE|nr:cytochrome c [Candidatus Tectomicrobia bacterium]
MVRILGGAAAFVVVILMAGGVYAADAAAGKAAYQKRCVACHGADGKGNVGMAKALQVTIPDFTDAAVVTKLGKDGIQKTVASGKGKMAAIKGVNKEELDNIAAFVGSLAK